MDDSPEKNSNGHALAIGIDGTGTGVTESRDKSSYPENLDFYNQSSTTADLINEINIQDLINNDPNTWEEFGNLARAFMRDIVKKYGIDPYSAEDVYQEVLIKVMNKVDSYKGGLEVKFTSWLGVITANTCKDHLRRRRARPTISMDIQYKDKEDQRDPVRNDLPSSDKPEEEVLSLLGLRDVLTKMSKFLDQEDLELMLLVAKGYSYQEMAKLMNLNINTVKSRISRARKKLKKVRKELYVALLKEE